MDRPETAPKSQESKNTDSTPAACCATTELATCCEPAAKGGCCGPQAETVERAPSSCGCR